MRDRDPFSGEPDDTSERIMRATLHTLERNGYAGLSLQRIADESGLSKSSVYHFYDGKDDLLVAFLDFMIERWRTEFQPSVEKDPAESLRMHLTHALTGSPPSEDERPTGTSDFGPFVELRAQAVTNEEYRQRFSEFDEVVTDVLATIVERGIDSGVFRDVDPDGTAELLMTLMMGAIVRRSTIEQFDADTLHDEMDGLIERHFLADGQDR